MEWYTVIRSGSIILALISMALLFRKAYKYWPEYQTRTKDFWWVLLCWVIAVLFGTLEIILGWDSQIRVLFTFFALALTVKLLLKPNEVEKPTFTNEF